MKQLVLDIPDREYDFFMKVIKNFSFVKAKPFSSEKVEILEGIKESVEEMKLIKAGKLKGRPAEDLFNEL